MIPSYHMVVVNLILSSLLVLFLVFYKFIYPKKKINIFLLLILISILPIISIFRAGSYQSGDLNYHTIRTISYFNVLFTEHTLPRWTPEFYGGYGDPYAMFAYQLPYIFGSLIHLFGFSFLNSIKVLFALSFIVSGITMYLWAKEELKNKIFAFVSAIFYLFAPYHLLDMHFRASIAESLSFVFPPLLLYLTKKFIDEGGIKYFVYLPIVYFLLILSHHVIALAFTPILIFYAFFLFYQKGKVGIIEVLYYFFSLFFAVWFSSFYWFPVFIESKYIHTFKVFLASSTWEILYSPYRFGFLFQGHKGELSLIIGYTQLLVIFLSLFLVFKKRLDKKIRNLLIFSLLIVFVLIFMILSVSEYVWSVIPFIKNFQYSYRLLVLVALFSGIIAGMVTKIINKNWFTTTLVIITISYTILNWGNRTMININDEILKGMMYSPSTFSSAEYQEPIWTDPNKTIFTSTHLNVITGDASAKEVKRTPYHHFYNIEVKSQSEFMERTTYFPGWTLTVNGKDEAINYKNTKYPGIITFKLPKGRYNIELSYRDTQDRSISYKVSLIGVGAFLCYVLYAINKKGVKKKKHPKGINSH